MKRLTVALLPVAAVLSTLSAGPAAAGCHLIDCVENVYIKASQVKNHSCEDLWVLRNSIYKDAGYCFKTAKAKSWFGNDGCKYADQDEVPLNAYQRHNVKVLKSVEAKNGC